MSGGFFRDLVGQSEAEELAERWADKVLDLVESNSASLAELGRPVKVALNSSARYMVQGAAFIERGDPAPVRENKAKRARAIEYQENVASISPRDFEFLCSGVLELLGVENIRTTQSSVDEGIDFYGRLKLKNWIQDEDMAPNMEAQLTVWLVGQAKHYRSARVTTPEIRDLVGAVVLAKSHAFGRGGPEKFADLKIRACDPAWNLFFTTGTISSDGWELMRNSGTVGMDGEMLAEFLASRNIGVRNGLFDPDLFSEWLRGIRARQTR